MDKLESILAMTILGNPVKSYAIAFLVFFGIWILTAFVIRITVKRLEPMVAKTPAKWATFALTQIRKVHLSVYIAIALFFALRLLNVTPIMKKSATFFLVLVITIGATRLLLALLSFYIDEVFLKRHKEKVAVEAQAHLLFSIIKYAVWIAAVVFLIDNLGVNISTLVAGLGIGGIAVALAVQTILKDLFSSFSIFLDKPFQIGDFIIVNEHMGTVEHIGIKTTRIRSLTGELLVISNADLTASRIRNYKHMDERRIVFSIGVTYNTKIEHLKKIRDVIAEIIKGTPKTRLDRVHFKGFGDFSLNFEIVYYVLSRDYNIYMDVQQDINLAIKEQLEAIGVEFAFPTQTLHVATPQSATNLKQG